MVPHGPLQGDPLSPVTLASAVPHGNGLVLLKQPLVQGNLWSTAEVVLNVAVVDHVLDGEAPEDGVDLAGVEVPEYMQGESFDKRLIIPCTHYYYENAVDDENRDKF